MASYSIDISTANSVFTFNTQNGFGFQTVPIDDNHFVCLHSGNNNGDDISVTVLEVNTSTWAVSTSSTTFVVETGTLFNSTEGIAQIDDSHFLVVYARYVGIFKWSRCLQVIEVNTSTYSVSTSNSALVVNTEVANITPENSIVAIDTNHFLLFADNNAQVFEVNTSTWAVTTSASALSLGTSSYNRIIKIDTTHFAGFYRGSDSFPSVVVLEVNTSTWAVTTANSVLALNGTTIQYTSFVQLDNQYYVCLFADVLKDISLIPIHINNSTWEVTTAGPEIDIDTSGDARYNNAISIDSNNFAMFWTGEDNDGFASSFYCDTTGGTVTVTEKTSPRLEFDTTMAESTSVVSIDTGHYLAMWHDSADVANAQVFNIVKQFEDTLSEGVNITQSIIKDIYRLIPESITNTQSFQVISVFIKQFTESFIMVATIGLVTMKNFAEAVTITGTKILDIVKSVFDESVSIADNIISVPAKTLNEVVQIAASLARLTMKNLVESIVSTDSKNSLMSKVISVAIRLADSVNNLRYATFAETIRISQFIAKSTAKMLQDAVQITVATFTVARAVLIQEAITIGQSFITMAKYGFSSAKKLFGFKGESASARDASGIYPNMAGIGQKEVNSRVNRANSVNPGSKMFGSLKRPKL